MSRVFLSLLLILTVTPLYAQTNYGVNAKERVVKLPEDASKWHVSVVGQGERYQTILGWFDNGRLKELKAQVMFHPVTPSDPIYADRYAPNTKTLPMVRVQNEKGSTIFEAAGDNIPMTGEGLYAAIASAVNGSEEWLPWRRNNKKDSEPTPEPVVPDTDPEPQPLDNGGAPVLEPVDELPNLLPLIACVALFVGGVLGQVQASKKYHSGK
jgi:hypothetical protein